MRPRADLPIRTPGRRPRAGRSGRLPGALLLALGGGALVASCSVLNSYPEPKPYVPAADAASESAVAEASPGDSAPGPGDSSADTVGPADTQSADTLLDSGADARLDGTLTDGPDATDAAVDTGPVSTGPRGVIVVGGQVESDGGLAFVLTALDPTTGYELPNARVPMIVSAVVYDPSSDTWYIFESGGAGIYPLPTDPFYLHARKIDPVSGTWTESFKTLVPSGVSYLTTALVNGELVYLAYPTSDAGAGGSGVSPVNVPSPYGLVTAATTADGGVSAMALPAPTGAPFVPTGIVTLANSFFGGTALLGNTSGFNAPVAFTTLLLANGGASPGFTTMGPPTSGASFGVVTVNTANMSTPYFLVVTTSPPALGLYDTMTGSLYATGGFSFADTVVRPPAFSECFQTAFVVGANADTAVHAIPLPQVGAAPAADGGLPPLAAFAASTGHSGQAVYFEPYTNTVLAPFSQGDNFVLSAFTVVGTPAAPTLVPRGAPYWQPPPELRPNFVATRALPTGTICPTPAD